MAKSNEPRKIDGTADMKESEEMAAQKLNKADKSDKDDKDEGASDPDVEPPNDPKQFPELIGDGLVRIMYARVAHLEIEKEMDDWFRNLPANRNTRIDKLREAREQIETAKLAIDALYMRFRSMASTAKN